MNTLTSKNELNKKILLHKSSCLLWHNIPLSLESMPNNLVKECEIPAIICGLKLRPYVCYIGVRSSLGKVTPSLLASAKLPSLFNR